MRLVDQRRDGLADVAAARRERRFRGGRREPGREQLLECRRRGRGGGWELRRRLIEIVRARRKHRLRGLLAASTDRLEALSRTGCSASVPSKRTKWALGPKVFFSNRA